MNFYTNKINKSLTLKKRRMTGLEPKNGATNHCLNHLATPAFTSVSIALDLHKYKIRLNMFYVLYSIESNV